MCLSTSKQLRSENIFPDKYVIILFICLVLTTHGYGGLDTWVQTCKDLATGYCNIYFIKNLCSCSEYCPPHKPCTWLYAVSGASHATPVSEWWRVSDCQSRDIHRQPGTDRLWVWWNHSLILDSIGWLREKHMVWLMLPKVWTTISQRNSCWIVYSFCIDFASLNLHSLKMF